MPFDKNYFKQLFTSFPELLCFLTKGIDATQDYKITEMAPWMEEMYAAAQEKIPEALRSFDNYPNLYLLLNNAITDQRSIELERTCLCLMTMNAVIENNYEFFRKTKVLTGEPISQEQFNRLKSLVARYFPKESRKLLVFELILGDFGKIRPLREGLCQQFDITAQDPDHFMAALFEQDYTILNTVFPCLSHIDEQQFSELKKINTGFHYGHFAHAESTEREIEKLRLTIKTRGIQYLYKNILIQIFDVAGAAAQNQGKILLNKSIFHTYLDDMFPVLETLEKSDSPQAYQRYLIQRLNVCSLLPKESEIKILAGRQYILGRLLCMFRIYDESSAQILNKALDYLFPKKGFNLDIKFLIQYQTNPKFNTPTYMPAFLNALKDSNRIMELGEKEENDRQVIALRVGIKIIVETLRAHQSLVDNGELGSSNPINFNQLTGIVKSNFDAIKFLCENNGVSIDKSNGIVYPSLLIKYSEVSKYAHAQPQYSKSRTDFFYSEKDYINTKDIEKTEEEVEAVGVKKSYIKL